MALRSYAGPFRVKGLNVSRFESEYDLGKRFSDKVIGVRNKITGVKYVAYRLPKIESPGNEPEELKLVIKQLQRIEHPNICKLLEAFDDPAFIIIIYQELTGVNLLGSLKHKEPDERYVGDVVSQLLRAVSAASMVGCSHGALTPKNILLDAVGRLVVVNYGLIDVMRQDPVHKLSREQISYLAPEVICEWAARQLKGRKPTAMHPWERMQKSAEADLWSVGVIAYQLLTGNLPFNGRGLYEVSQSILHDDIDFGILAERHVRPEAKEFLQACLSKDPRWRQKAEDLLHHPWLKQLQALREESCAKVDGEILANLSSLHRESEFKKCMMRFVAETLPPSKLRSLEAQFMKLDINGDGFISLNELKQAIMTHPHFRHAMVDAESVFAQIDVDNGGVISLHEFIISTLDTQFVLMETVLWDAFKRIDANHDGIITKEELHRVVNELGGGNRLSEDHLADMIRLIEHEIPEQLTFEEFTHIVREEGGKERRKILRTLDCCSHAFHSCGSAVLEKAGACTDTMKVGDPRKPHLS